ncbi:MAG: imidazole glycerol phosphate synthase subunit HisH [Chloroflexi bacterium]|nr:imidazole glycerol phosphate synthase subunit HisH [Chloroflexota bacterium]
MIVIIDYGAGNLHSVKKAVEFVGGQANVTNDPSKIMGADKVILPGVGAFKDGLDGLQARNLIIVIKDYAATGKPLLGICLGMQLLFEESKEQGVHPGLGLLPGQVVPFTDTSLKIPQIGWNTLSINKEAPLFSGLRTGDYVYFNHTFYCCPQEHEDTLTSTEYGISFSSAVNRSNIYGVQFHPEKSQKIGLKILQNFVERIS